METMTFKETVDTILGVVWSILVWYTKPIRRLVMKVEKFKCEQCGAETRQDKEPNGWIVLKAEKILWYGNPTLKVDRIRREHFSNKDRSLDFCGYSCFEAYFRKLLGADVPVEFDCSCGEIALPQKTVKVVLEKYNSITFFKVWTDLSLKEMQGVPGIVRVYDTHCCSHSFNIEIDPRYNVDHIKAYIEGMVHARS